MRLRITKMMQKSIIRHPWTSLLLLLVVATPLLAQNFLREIWTYDIGNDDHAMDVAVDGKGIAYVLAAVGNDGEPPSYVIIQYAPNGDIIRTIQFDNGADGSYPKAIAVDANDNLYVTGVRANGTSNDDCLIISYTDTGSVRWEQTIDNNNRWDSGNTITIDSRGDVVVGGNSADTADGRIQGSTMLISKYDADGNMLVSPIYPYSALPQTDSVISISTDGNGNVYALDLWNTQPRWRVYKFDPSLQYVYSVAVDPLTSELAADQEGNFYTTSWDLESGNYDAKLSKYATDGTLACEATYDKDPITVDRAYGIAIDETGDIYVVGHANNSYLTLKYNSDCSPIWSTPLIWEGEGYFSLASAIAVDSLGNLYVTGTVGGEIIPTESQHDVATLKYTSPYSKEEVWIYDIGNDDYAMDVAVDGKGIAYVLAAVGDDGEPPSYVIIQYAPNGDITRTIHFDDGADGSYPKAIAVDANDNLYVTGVRANGTSNDDCLTISYTDTGSVRWEQTIDNNNRWDSGNAITIDSRGDVVVGGNSARTADGRIQGSTMLISKYDANGNMLVPPIYPYYALPQTDSVISISTDGNGNVYAMDLWNNFPKRRVYKFDPLLQYIYSIAVDPLTSEVVAADLEGNFYVTSLDLETGNYDAKLSKYDSDGNLACEATYDKDPTTKDRAYGIAIDEIGEIYLVGHANNRYLTLKYDSSCSPVWLAPLIWEEGKGYFNLASAIAVDSLGNLYVTGTVGGELIPSVSQHDVATLKYTNLGAPPAIPLPDLAMTEVSGPVSASNGDSIVISNSVTNRGLDCDCASMPFPVEMYLSKDWMITTEDTLLGSRQVVDMLLRDEEDNQDTPVMIPDSIDYGSYYLGAVADSTDVIQEMAEYNNGQKGNQIFISRPLPDLVMLAASGPATAIRGQQISIYDKLMNHGLDTGGPFSVGLYLSTDPIITTEDVLLGSREVGLLATGEETSQDTFVTIPASLDVGLYYLGVIADSYDAIAEWDETNNALVGSPIWITLPAPDLIVTSVSSPTSAAQGEEIVVPHTISNQGAALDPYDMFWVYFYLSTDEIITTDDIMLNGFGWGSATWGGSTSSNVTIPDSVAAGTYYLGAVVDPTDTISEWDETNNGMAGNTIQITFPEPDLIMTSVSGPTSAAPGEEIVVPHSTGNQGSALAPDDVFLVYFYLSTDEIITTDDIVLTGSGWGSATWGGSTSSNVTIPDSVANGTYYLGAVVDATDRVSEWDEANNGMAGNVITITSPTCEASCHRTEI